MIVYNEYQTRPLILLQEDTTRTPPRIIASKNAQTQHPIFILRFSVSKMRTPHKNNSPVNSVITIETYGDLGLTKHRAMKAMGEWSYRSTHS
jgi:hypothetical protein